MSNLKCVYIAHKLKNCELAVLLQTLQMEHFKLVHVCFESRFALFEKFDLACNAGFNSQMEEGTFVSLLRRKLRYISFPCANSM